MTATNRNDRTELPATIRSYLAAHVARDADAAIEAFAPDAVVVDQGRTFRGRGAVLDFLHEAGTEFSYTTELVGFDRIDEEHVEVRQHLEGDFPGGVADLRYRFTLGGDRITELVITP